MKIVSWNVNGLRACEKKGAIEQLIENLNPDVLLIQEIKMQAEHTAPFMEKYSEYEQKYNHAEKKGYSGTAVWTKRELRAELKTGMDGWEGNEGRIVRADVGDLTILGGYFPNGGKSAEAWDEKLEFYDHFLDWINDLRESGRKVVWGGDVNCAHEEIDLARPKANDGKVGFHPLERAWVTKCTENNWSDLWRARNKEKVAYSWWSIRGGARARNVGWRIDYFFADEGQVEVKDVYYLPEFVGSDHCPVVLEVF